MDDFVRGPKVKLNDYTLVCEGALTMEVTNTYGRKIQQGDPGPDDHPVNSTITNSSWLGGGQVYKKWQPSEHTERFWWATLWTQTPGAMALPPQSFDYDPPATASGASLVLGAFPLGSAGKMYATWGAKLCRYNKTLDAFEVALTLAAAPVGKATIYTYASGANAGVTRMFIPQGSRYEVFDGSALVPAEYIATETAVDFEVQQDKLFKLGNDGTIKFTTDGVTWTAKGRISDGSTPRKLISFYDRSNQPNIHAVTNRSVFSHDFTNGILHKTDLQFPMHPHQGKGAALWRADMFVSVGIGAHRQAQGLISASGLDRDEGLPVEYRGHIVDLEPSYNVLFALLQGQTIGDAAQETYTLQAGQGDPMYGAVGDAYSVLMGWNGYGWHYYWHGQGAAPTTVSVADVDDTYRVWWAAGGQVWRQELPIGYINPLDNATYPYAEQGEFISPWYDWGWKDIPKILKRINLKTVNCSTTEFIEVSYRTTEGSWTPLTTITTDDEHEIDVGININGDPVGVEHERVQLRMVFHREAGDANNMKTPVLEWFALVGRKWLRPQRVWRFQVSLLDPAHGYDPGTLRAMIDGLVHIKGAVPFVYNDTDGLDERVMVDVVSVGGNIDIGEFRSYRSVNVMEANESE